MPTAVGVPTLALEQVIVDSQLLDLYNKDMLTIEGEDLGHHDTDTA
jgi:hypothetical protein